MCASDANACAKYSGSMEAVADTLRTGVHLTTSRQRELDVSASRVVARDDSDRDRAGRARPPLFSEWPRGSDPRPLCRKPLHGRLCRRSRRTHQYTHHSTKSNQGKRKCKNKVRFTPVPTQDSSARSLREQLRVPPLHAVPVDAWTVRQNA